MRKRTHSSWRAHFAGRFGVPVALLGLVSGISPLTATVGAHAGTMQNYIVLYKQQATPADAASTIALAGGVFVYSYDAIGVAIARSDNDQFLDNLLMDNRIENASATARFALALAPRSRSQCRFCERRVLHRRRAQPVAGSLAGR